MSLFSKVNYSTFWRFCLPNPEMLQIFLPELGPSLDVESAPTFFSQFSDLFKVSGFTKLRCFSNKSNFLRKKKGPGFLGSRWRHQYWFFLTMSSIYMDRSDHHTSYDEHHLLKYCFFYAILNFQPWNLLWLHFRLQNFD